MTRRTRFSQEVRERAVRMVVDHESDYGSRWEAICSIAEKIGCSPETLRKWLLRAEVDSGARAGITMQDPSITPGQTIFLTEYEAVVIPFDGALRLTGFLELSGVNMRLLPRRIKALRRVASRYLERVPEGKTEEQWTGMRACTPDGVPAIGRLPELENAWVGSGHWHFGLTLAPATGTMLAELITEERSSVDNAPFDPGRF